MPSRVKDVMSMLRAAHLDIDVEMANHDGNLTPRFVDYCQLHCAETTPAVQLTWRQRQILLMYYRHEMTQAQIAERLRIDVRTVQRDLYKACAKIADVVDLSTAPLSWSYEFG